MSNHHFDNDPQPPTPLHVAQAWDGFRRRLAQHETNQQLAQQLADLAGWMLELDDCLQAQIAENELLKERLGLPTACSEPKRGFQFYPAQGGTFRAVPSFNQANLFEPAPSPIDGPRDYDMGEDEQC